MARLRTWVSAHRRAWLAILVIGSTAMCAAITMPTGASRSETLIVSAGYFIFASVTLAKAVGHTYSSECWVYDSSPSLTRIAHALEATPGPNSIEARMFRTACHPFQLQSEKGLVAVEPAR